MLGIKRFILFHGKRHPREMGASEVAAFLTHLAVAGDVSASTQNQALSALLFCAARCWGKSVSPVRGLLQITIKILMASQRKQQQTGYVVNPAIGQ